MRFFRKSWINWSANAILLLIILTCVFILVVPTFFYASVAVVLTSSMKPALPRNALAFVASVNPQEIKVGDIIAYSSTVDSDITTSHRVVEILTEGGFSFRTKGDDNENADPIPVPANMVKGKVFFHVPRLGGLLKRANIYVQSWYGFSLLVGLPALIIIGSTLRSIGRPRSLRQRRLDILERRRQRWKAFAR